MGWVEPAVCCRLGPPPILHLLTPTQSHLRLDYVPREDGQVGGWVGAPSMKKGSWLCLVWLILGPSSPKPGGGIACLHFPRSQLPKRKLPWAPRPLNVISGLPEPGWPDLNVTGPFSLGPEAS